MFFYVSDHEPNLDYLNFLVFRLVQNCGFYTVVILIFRIL